MRTVIDNGKCWFFSFYFVIIFSWLHHSFKKVIIIKYINALHETTITLYGFSSKLSKIKIFAIHRWIYKY